MNSSIYQLSLVDLGVSLIPLGVVLIVLYFWGLNIRYYIYASVRMLAQLVMIGFVLVYVFLAKSPYLIFLILVFMFSVASWIAMGPLRQNQKVFYKYSFLAVLIGAGSILCLIIFGVVDLKPWFDAKYVIPIAGMIFANGMNGLSLAAERYSSELTAGKEEAVARVTALKAAMLPSSNSFLAVGLVSLPGMMTGQILAGVSPMIAARYQVMVMSMVFGSVGLCSVLFLMFSRDRMLREYQK